jgi:hypothetical protein
MQSAPARKRRFALAASTFLLATIPFASVPLAAQWLKYPTAGIPRTAAGKPNLSAPAPRTADGKPDFSGMWITDNPVPCKPGGGGGFLECGIELPIALEGFNMGATLKGGLPYQPWAAQLVKKRAAENSKDDPHARCLPDTFLRSYGLPHYSKFVQVPGLLVVLNEVNAGYRQIFTDGRPLPEDPQPAWNGYSSAKWMGDTLVIESAGFRDDLWLDMSGSPLTDAARVTERIRRPDFGHLQVEVTVNDPKAYTKPWTITLKQALVVDTEMIDEICLENERSSQRMLAK